MNTQNNSSHKKIFIGRYDPEITLKSHPVRLHLQSLLVQRLSQRLKTVKLNFSMEKEWDKIIIFLKDLSDSQLENAIQILKTTFGVDYFYLADLFPTTELKTIKTIFRTKNKNKVTNKTFAVRIKINPRGKISHQQLEAEFGSLLYPFSKGVNLTKPEVLFQIWIDFNKNRTYFIDRKFSGPSGYPYGSSQPALVLFSGGIDSPVAAWMAARKGLKLHFLLLNQAGKEQLKLVQQVLEKFYRLWIQPNSANFYIADGEEIKRVLQNLPPRYRSFTFKYLLYRLADSISQHEKIPIIVTGESLNQVSSQTPSTLTACQSSLSPNKLIFRPLSAMTKREIINQARIIQTLELSEKVPEYCLKSKEGSITKADEQLLQELKRKYFPYEDKLISLTTYRKITLS